MRIACVILGLSALNLYAVTHNVVASEATGLGSLGIWFICVVSVVWDLLDFAKRWEDIN